MQKCVQMKGNCW